MPDKKLFLYAYLLLPALLFLVSCGNGNRPAKYENVATQQSTGNNAKTTYSDSLLLGDKPDDTIKYSDKDSESNMALPEEKQFQVIYNQITEALDKGSISDINKHIHKRWGIYIIDRPGAIDRVDTAKNIQSYYKKIYLGKKRLQGMMCHLEHRPIPEITCDKAYKGCLAESITDFHRLSDLKKALHGYGFKDNYLPKDDERLPEFEKLIKRSVVNFDRSVGISFLFIDGKWYIGVIDLAKYTCSA